MKRNNLPVTLTLRNVSYRNNHFIISMAVLLFVFTVLAGCSKEDSSSSKLSESEAMDIKKQAAPSDGEKQSPSESYYTESEILALGFRIVKLDEQHSLLCSNEDDRDCVCLEPLPCVEAGNCIGFEENINAFKAALNEKQEGSSVSCSRGEIGQCGDFKYFLFNGDIGRRELRWFDSSGALVAQRNTTDYNAYCDGKARTQFLGKIPKCESTIRTELICGQAEKDLATPLEDLRRLDPNKFR